MNPLVKQLKPSVLKETLDPCQPVDGPLATLTAYSATAKSNASKLPIDDSNKAAEKLQEHVRQAEQCLYRPDLLHSPNCKDRNQCESENGICPLFLESEECPSRALVSCAFEALDILSAGLERSSSRALQHVSATLKRGVYGVKKHTARKSTLLNMSSSKSLLPSNAVESLWGNRVKCARTALDKVNADISLWVSRRNEELESIEKEKQTLKRLSAKDSRFRKEYTFLESSIREVTTECHNVESQLKLQQISNQELEEKVAHLQQSIQHLLPQIKQTAITEMRDEMNNVSQQLLIASNGVPGSKVTDFFVPVGGFEREQEQFEKVCKSMLTLEKLDHLQDTRLIDDNQRITFAKARLREIAAKLEKVKEQYEIESGSYTPRPEWARIGSNNVLPGLEENLPRAKLEKLINDDTEAREKDNWTGNSAVSGGKDESLNPSGYTSLAVETMIDIISRGEREEDAIMEISRTKDHIALMEVQTQDLKKSIERHKELYLELTQKGNSVGEARKVSTSQHPKPEHRRSSVKVMRKESVISVADVIASSGAQYKKKSRSSIDVANTTKKFVRKLVSRRKKAILLQARRKRVTKPVHKPKRVSNPATVEIDDQTSTPDHEQNEEEVEGSGNYFMGLGYGKAVPAFLQAKGRIVKLHMSKKQVESMVREMVSKRFCQAQGQVVPMDHFLKEYLNEYERRMKKPSASSITLGYSFMHGLEEYIWDSDIETFLLVLTGKLPESLLQSQLRLVNYLQSKLRDLDAAECSWVHRMQFVSSQQVAQQHLHSGYVSFDNFKSLIKVLFPKKTDDSIERILNAAKRDLQRDSRSRVSVGVKYEVLFAESKDFDQSDFLEEIRTQNVVELREFMKELTTSLEKCEVNGKGMTTLGAIEAAIVPTGTNHSGIDASQLVHHIASNVTLVKKNARTTKLANKKAKRGTRPAKHSTKNSTPSESAQVDLKEVMNSVRHNLPPLMLCEETDSVQVVDVDPLVMPIVENLIQQKLYSESITAPRQLRSLARGTGLRRRKAETRLKISNADISGIVTTVSKEDDEEGSSQQHVRERSRHLHRKLAKEERQKRYKTLLGVYG